MKYVLAAGLGLLFLVPLLTRRPGGVPRLGPVDASQAHGGSQTTARAASHRRTAFERIGGPKNPRHADAALSREDEIRNDASGDPDGIEREARAVPEHELRAALDSLGLDPAAEAATSRQLLVRRWSDSDLPAAAAWALELPEGFARGAAIEQIAIAWGNSDLPGSVAWVQSLPGGESRTAAVLSLAYEAARTDPLAALRLAASLERTTGRDELLNHTIRQWAGMDQDSAAAWSRAVSDPSLREQLVASVGISMADRDAEAALAWILGQIPTGAERDRAVVSIAQRWNPGQPGDGRPALPELAGGISRDQAVRELRWLCENHESLTSGGRLEDLPENILRDTGVARVAVP